MSIISCPECGSGVSDLATICPRCGYPISEKLFVVAKSISSNTSLQAKFCNVIKGGFTITSSGCVSKKAFPKKEAEEMVAALLEMGITAECLSVDEAPILESSNAIRCPSCGSSSISLSGGFSIGKAALGAVALGPIGAAAGLLGKNKKKRICANCGHKW